MEAVANQVSYDSQCVYVDVDNGTIAYDERDPIIDLYPKNTVPTGSMGGVGKSVSTVGQVDTSDSVVGEEDGCRHVKCSQHNLRTIACWT